MVVSDDERLLLAECRSCKFDSNASDMLCPINQAESDPEQTSNQLLTGSNHVKPLAPSAIQRRIPPNRQVKLRAMTNRIGEVSDRHQQSTIEGLMHLAGAQSCWPVGMHERTTA